MGKKVPCRYCGKAVDDLIGAHFKCIEKEVAEEIALAKVIRIKVARCNKAIIAIEEKAGKAVQKYLNKICKLQKKCPHMSKHSDAYDSWCSDCGVGL